MSLSANDALEQLRLGNQRYVQRVPEATSGVLHGAPPSESPSPLAIVLTCSDIRVPPELLFDQAPGDLFVVQVAGNVLAPSLIASIELAASTYGTSVCVVLGHTRCAAIDLALERFNRMPPPASASPHLADLLERLAPSVRRALERRDPGGDLRDTCVEANVWSSVASLLDRSDLLSALSQGRGFRVKGAVFHADEGRVRFLGEARASMLTGAARAPSPDPLRS